MSSTLLEVTRASHEEVERLERLIVKDLQKEPTSNRERLFQNHRVRNRIESITSTTQRLVSIYEDKDNARKDEIAVLGGQTATGTNVFSAFYDRLKEIRENHRRNQNARVVDSAEEFEELLKEEPHVKFSGEEGYGRYLDLHELYNQYINSKFGEPIEYSAYLNVFSQPHKISRNLKLTRQYKEYLEHMLEYLIYFFQRTEPLQDLDRIFSKVETEFEDLWEDGKVEGWESKGLENGLTSTLDSAIDLDYYSTVEELIEVGPEKLKEALAALGLKTGGTIQQRAERLFLTKHTPIKQLDKKHFAKGSRTIEQNGGAAVSLQVTDSKDIALKEARMKRLCELLNETILQTKENVEKKQALTYEEMEAEREELAAHYLREKRCSLELALSTPKTSGVPLGNEIESSSESVIPSGYVGQFARLLEEGHALATQHLSDAEYILYALAEGKRFQDSFEIIALFKKSSESYSSLKAQRMASSCSNKMAREYFVVGDFSNAKQLFDGVASCYRQEGWVTLLWEVLGYLRECSKRLGSVKDFVEYSLEMASLPVPSGNGAQSFEGRGEYDRAGPHLFFPKERSYIRKFLDY